MRRKVLWRGAATAGFVLTAAGLGTVGSPVSAAICTPGLQATGGGRVCVPGPGEAEIGRPPSTGRAIEVVRGTAQRAVNSYGGDRCTPGLGLGPAPVPGPVPSVLPATDKAVASFCNTVPAANYKVSDAYNWAEQGAFNTVRDPGSACTPGLGLGPAPVPGPVPSVLPGIEKIVAGYYVGGVRSEVQDTFGDVCEEVFNTASGDIRG